MRVRSLKPGFFKNEDLAQCDPLARILFQGLWGLADREGRLEDRPQRIKVDVLPYDPCDIDALLDQLAARGFIVRYMADRKRFIFVTTFPGHQRPHPKEPPSVIPEYKAVEKTGKVRTRPCKDTAGSISNPSDPGSSDPGSSDPGSSCVVERATKRRVSTMHDSEIDAIYAAYPRREGKAPGMKTCAREFTTPEKREQLREAVKNYSDLVIAERKEREHILLWSTFVNGRWEDYLQPIASNGKRHAYTASETAALAMQLEREGR